RRRGNGRGDAPAGRIARAGRHVRQPGASLRREFYLGARRGPDRATSNASSFRLTMEIVYHAHHATITPGMRLRTERRLRKLERRLGRVVDATVRFEEDG